jgi:hypothetical protein
MPSRQQLTKTRSGGGKLLLRRKTPLKRRSVAYFHSGAHKAANLSAKTGVFMRQSGKFISQPTLRT